MEKTFFDKVDPSSIIKNSPIETILKLCQTNKFLNEVCHRPATWEMLLKRDYPYFKLRKGEDPEQSYRHLYSNRNIREYTVKFNSEYSVIFLPYMSDDERKRFWENEKYTIEKISDDLRWLPNLNTVWTNSENYQKLAEHLENRPYIKLYDSMLTLLNVRPPLVTQNMLSNVSPINNANNPMYWGNDS